MTFPSNENYTVLLISNSKLLKNKFIESLNNETNQFSLMKKTIEYNKLPEKITLECLICDYVYDTESNSSETCYVQIIDINDKNIINYLIGKSNELGPKKFKFFVNSIVYLYDESQSDTFAYIKTIHNDIKNFIGDFVFNENLKIILFNMANAINSKFSINMNDNETKNSLSTLFNAVETFLDEFKMIEYVPQFFNDSTSKIEDYNDNKIKQAFDLMILSQINNLPIINKTNIEENVINTQSNSLKSALSAVNKNMYTGEMTNNLRNGFGVYVYDNKYFKYEGEWRNGVKHGFGKFIFGDGSFYEGQFKDGEITGNGFKLDKMRDTEYKGEFVEGTYHGKGHLRCKNQFIYQGDFYNNMRHGYGEFFEIKTNRNYKGQWYFNKRQGQGIQHYSDGSTYSGDWIQDKRQGHGEYILKDETIYDVCY